MKTMLFTFLILIPLFVATCLGPILLQIRDDQRAEPTVPVTPSPTSYPALSRRETRERVVELLQTNGGCRLPCWWGIVPGKTRWETVHALLSPLLESDWATDLLVAYEDRSSTWGPNNPMLPMVESYLRNSIVQDILVSNIQGNYLTKLDISHIFQTYGKPDEIYISTSSCTGINRCELQIFLYYPHLGMAIVYDYALDSNARFMHLCHLNEPEKADFYLWHGNIPADIWYGSTHDLPGDFYTVAARARWNVPGHNNIRPLNEATSFTIDTFYETFHQLEASATCIETPTNLWVRMP